MTTTTVVTDATWTTLDLAYGGGTDGVPSTTLNAEPSGWHLVGFDDSAWAAAIVPPDPLGAWRVVSGASFIIAGARAAGQLLNAMWITRVEFTMAANASADATLELGTDNWAKLWIDGVLIADLTTQFGIRGEHSPNWAGTNSFSVSAASLTAGTHCIAAQVWQDAYSGTWGANPTMLIARLAVPTSAPTPPAPGVVIDPTAVTPIPIGDDIISWRITRGASAEITGAAQPGSCVLVVRNDAGNSAGEDAYNPENGSSPLISYLKDGTAVWVGVNNDGKLAGSDPRGLFGGRFTDITPLPAPGATVPPTVEIVAEDALGWLGRVPVSLDYATGRSQRSLRELILATAGETRTDLDDEITTMPLSAGDGNALALLESINKSNGTRHLAKPADASTDWYTYVTHNRQYRLDGTVDYTLSQLSNHVTGTSGWRLSADTVTNQQRASTTPVKFTPSTFAVWSAESLPLLVTTTRPVDLWMDFDDYVSAPLVNSAHSGSTPTITLTSFGTRAHLTITVASGTCTFTHLSIEGALARRLPAESYVADDLVSQVLPRGVREGSEISGEYVGILESARGIAEHVVWRYADPQVRPTVVVENWFPYMFDVELGEIVSYTSPQLGVTSRLFEVVGLTHEGNVAAATVQHHVLTLVLQECRVQADPGWFTWDVSVWDGSDVLAY